MQAADILMILTKILRECAHEITLISGHTHGAWGNNPGVASVVRSSGAIRRIIFGEE